MNGTNDSDSRPPVNEAEARREFLRRIGKASAAAPAVALLMAANVKAQTNPVVSGASGSS